MEKSGLSRGIENQGVEADRQLDEAATDHQGVTDLEAELHHDHPDDPIETEAAAEVETEILDEADETDLIQDRQLMKKGRQQEKSTERTKNKMKEKN
jgi:hypothetical protein